MAASACVLAGVLALGVPMSAPKDVVLDLSDPAGRETVISKEAKTGKPAAASLADGFEPTTVHHLLTMALAPALPKSGTRRDAEPNLRGLSEIPRELIWNRSAEDDKEKRKSAAAFSRVSENLPWDAVEPVHFTPLGPRTKPGKAAPQRTNATPTPQTVVELPGGGEVRQWIKSKVTEIKGSARTRPLFHFELWLEPPADVKQRLVGVSYAFNSPAIRPQAQTSSDKTSGFRINAGGLACADEVTLTLRFDDGRSHTVALDGCKLLG